MSSIASDSKKRKESPVGVKSKRKSEKLKSGYGMEFEAPVFQLETAIKNMSYTVDTFCKKMGNIEKCSNRLFYGLWLLLDIYVNGKETNVNIKKDSLLTKDQFASQTIKLTGEILREESIAISNELVDVDYDLDTAQGNSNDLEIERLASEQTEASSQQMESSSPNRRMVIEPPQTAQSKEVEAEKDIKLFMLYYMEKNDLDMDGLDDNFSSVKQWLETKPPPIPEVERENNAQLHELYVKVFKTHGYFFGGMRDAINNALNTKLPKSQAQMAGVHNRELSVIHDTHPFIETLEGYYNLRKLLEGLGGEKPEEYISSFDRLIKMTLTETQLDEEVKLEDEEEARSPRSYLEDVTGKMQKYVEEIKKEERNTAGIKTEIQDLLQKLGNVGTTIVNSGMDVDDDSLKDNMTKLKNKFFKNKGFEKLRRDFFHSLEIEIKIRSTMKVDEDMEEDKRKNIIEEQRKMKEFLIKHYKEQDVTIDDKKVTLNTGCMVKHIGANPPGECDCCSVIDDALNEHGGKTFHDLEDDSSLAALIKEIFDETVYILDDDNPLLRKVGENVKIDMDEWRKKHIMGGLLEHMTDIQRMEERKYRSWITSCLMPLNEDGSLFKNEYEHVFPVLFLFLFVGGYIHMPSSSAVADGLKTNLYTKLQQDEKDADREYKEKVDVLAASYNNHKITKEVLESKKRLAWTDHRIKKEKIYKVVNLLNAIELFPFNDYNYNLLKFMFGHTDQGNLKLLDYIVDTIFLFRESVLLCESDPNQYKSNAIYAKVSANPNQTQLWSSSNQGITRFLIPIEQRIQAIDYQKSIEMNRRARVTALYAGHDTDVFGYASSNMVENTGALSESLVNASHPIWVECDITHLETQAGNSYEEHEFQLSLPPLSFTKTKKGNSNISIRDFYTDFNADIQSHLAPGKKLAYARYGEGDDREIYFFSRSETGNRVILKKGDSFNLIQYLNGEKNTSRHVIESVEYVAPTPTSPGVMPVSESQVQGTIKIKFRCYIFKSFTSRSSSPNPFSGGKKRKKKRTKKKRRRKKKTRGKR